MSKPQIRIWDIPTRLFHWGLVSSVVYAWFSVEILEDMQQHFYAGFTALTLLIFRIVWGFVGPRYARFSSFIFSPREILEYAKRSLNKSNKYYLGHNPLGSLSVFAMLLVLMFQASSGLFSSDDYYHGPLSGLIDSALVSTISGLHLQNVNLIKAFVALHIIAIIYYRLAKKEKLTRAMITGKKESDALGQGITSSRLALAIMILLVCIAIVYGLANAYLDLLPTDEYLEY